MKRRVAAASALLLFVAAVLVWLEQPRWLPAPLAAAGRDRVLVFVVDDARQVEQIRRAVDPRRVLYANDRAIVLAPGRIVATDTAAVTKSINDVGWQDRPLELFRVEHEDLARRARDGRRAAGTDDDAEAERLARLRELTKQPTLSYSEQLAVLQAIDDGVEF